MFTLKMNVLFLFLSKSELFDTILSYWELIVVLCFRTVCLCFFSILWAWTYLCFLFFFFFLAFLCIVSHSVPLRFSYKTHLMVQLGMFSLAALWPSKQRCQFYKSVPQFLQRPMGQKIKYQPWESQALLSSLGSEPCLPCVLRLT